MYGNNKRSTHSPSVSSTFSALVSIAYSKSAMAVLSIGSTLFFLTFFRVGRESKVGIGKEAPLTTLVLHDGTLYFFILFRSALIFSVGSALH
ncbi:hypothetical protein BDQ17DRAFT_1373732 [Cyathus striatus]|nr:hypothetical protein BDQ17DRAFT_1373732 [Cyathus striatus]